jgi:hypothetical protein
MMNLPSVSLHKDTRPVITTGQEIPAGEFFWIESGVGFAENACHGQGINRDRVSSPGSADTDCKVRVLRVDGDFATLVLIRPRTPYGAPAPHGTIFVLPVEQILRWPEIAAERERKQRALEEFRRQLGRVVV